MSEKQKQEQREGRETKINKHTDGPSKRERGGVSFFYDKSLNRM